MVTYILCRSRQEVFSYVLARTFLPASLSFIEQTLHDLILIQFFIVIFIN